MSKERKYKYYPEDFPELQVENIHYDLVFDMSDEHTDVSSKISFKTTEKISEIALDAKKMEITEVVDVGICFFEFGKPDTLLAEKCVTS